jgi:predicted ATP-grasp superfamily ATP-dependent carboligase
VDENDGLLFVVTENLAPAEACWSIAEALMKWLLNMGTKEFYALEGLPFGAPSEGVSLGFGYKIDINKMGIQSLRDGAISGISSFMLDLCMQKGLPFVALFVPTNRLTAIDYGASANGVEILNRIFKIGVDPTPLKQSDESIRKALEQQQKPGIGKIFKRT